jgi:hypothetical protein
MKTCPINHIYIIQTNFARVKTKNHVIQLCNIDNFVEKNEGDADEDYHVKRRIT